MLNECIKLKINWDDLTFKNLSFENSTLFNLDSPSHIINERYRGVEITTYYGETVAIKRLRQESVNLKNANVIVDLNVMDGLRHENISTIVGLCTDTLNVCIVMKFATRGSISDIISKSHVKLDLPFKVSMITDIARGMQYLHHSPVMIHGHLTSSKCLVDGRWT